MIRVIRGFSNLLPRERLPNLELKLRDRVSICWPFVAAALPVYRLYGGRPSLGLNHRQGDTLPAEAERRIVEWFESYL